MEKIILMLLLLAGSNFSGAGEQLIMGLCFACSGSKCPGSGLPCDDDCSGKALKDMGEDFSDAAGDLEDEYKTLEDKVKKAADGYEDIAIDTMDDLTDANDAFVDGLSAAEKRVELNLSASIKGLETNTDSRLKLFANTLKERRVNRGVADNARHFGAGAQPKSGSYYAAQARAVKSFSTQIEQVSKASVNKFIDYVNDKNNTEATGGRGAHQTHSLMMLDKLDKLYLMLHEDTLDAEDFQGLQEVIGLSVASHPNRPDSDGYDANYEMERKRRTSMLAMAYSALLRPAASRMGVATEGGADVYGSAEKNAEGKISLSGLEKARVIDQTGNPDWWGEVLSLNKAGLHREKTYQLAIANQIKSRLDSLSVESGNLLAIVLAIETETTGR